MQTNLNPKDYLVPTVIETTNRGERSMIFTLGS